MVPASPEALEALAARSLRDTGNNREQVLAKALGAVSRLTR
jgi:hypothetical protein